MCCSIQGGWCQWEKKSFLQLALFHQSCLKLSKNIVLTTCLSRFVWPLKQLDFPSGLSHCSGNLFPFLVSFYLFIVYILPFSLMIQDCNPDCSTQPLLILSWSRNSDFIEKWPWGGTWDGHFVKMSFQLLSSINKQDKKLSAHGHLFKQNQSPSTPGDLQVVLLHLQHAGRWPFIPLLRLCFSHFVTSNVPQKH